MKNNLFSFHFHFSFRFRFHFSFRFHFLYDMSSVLKMKNNAEGKINNKKSKF